VEVDTRQTKKKRGKHQCSAWQCQILSAAAWLNLVLLCTEVSASFTTDFLPARNSQVSNSAPPGRPAANRECEVCMLK